MSEPRYDILFAGEILAGNHRDTVAENLARLFKATPETVARLMDGGTHVLKRGTDRETALKYESAMQRAGARAILREVAAESAPTPPPPQTPAPAPMPADPAPARTAGPDATGLSLAPPGSEVLAPHERRSVDAVVVDTSGIALASVFAAPSGTDRPPPPAAPDTSHISIAAPGADLLEGHHAPAPPPPPDTAALSLAAPGARLAPQEERPPIAPPDPQDITLAPPGALLEELKPERKPLNPDTSGISLLPAGG